VKLLRSLTEIADPVHSVLLMWDCQNALVDRAFNKNEFVEATTALLAWARTARLPVIFSKIVPLPLEWEAGPRTARLMERFGIPRLEDVKPLLPPGSPGADIAAWCAPRDDEPVLAKHTTSMFIGTHFEYMLANRGIHSVLLAGISTDQGIEATARDATNRGLYAVVLEDCVSSADREGHDIALALMRRFCRVCTSAELRAARVTAADD
jgi:nicotinamidase-related amidase